MASGLGGGSSDAAAALRVIRKALRLIVPDEVILHIARSLGSDVPACLLATSVIATGRGDQLARVNDLPDLNAVLVNPGLPSPTAAVYRAYDRNVSAEGADAPDWPDALRGPIDVARFLAHTRNDLQAPAIGLQPAIGEVLSTLESATESLFARMSGSGATCFALCATARDAQSLAMRVSSRRPAWWVRACRLGSVDLRDGAAT